MDQAERNRRASEGLRLAWARRKAEKMNDWRIGMAATPTQRGHRFFRKVGIVRKIADGVAEIEMLASFDGEYAERSDEPMVLHEPIADWMTA